MTRADKQNALMRAEAWGWESTGALHQTYELFSEVARSLSPGGLKGRVEGTVMSESDDEMIVVWELRASLVPVLWFTTTFQQAGPRTFIDLEVQRALFSRQFPFPWTMTGRDKLRRFKEAVSVRLEDRPAPSEDAPGEDEVAYYLDDWDPATTDEVTAALDVAGIPWSIHNRDLVVASVHEAACDVVVAAVTGEDPNA